MLRTGIAFLAVGLAGGSGWLLGPQAFEHYHDSGEERHAHSHVHAGAHRHDTTVALSHHDHHHHHHHHHEARPFPHRQHPDPAPAPEPNRGDGSQPDGRYIPAAGPVVAHSVSAAPSFAAPDLAALDTSEACAPTWQRSFDHQTSPRGPPA